MSTKSSRSDQLTQEVAELLDRTDALLTSAGGDRGSDFRAPSSTRTSFKEASAHRVAPSPFSLRSSTDVEAGDALSEAASRLRGSFEAASRKLSTIKRSSSLAKPHGADLFRRKLSGVLTDTPTQRLTDGEAGRDFSVRFSDPSASEDPNLGSQAPSLPETVGAGRAYNSFGGLQDMVSMVDDLLSPTSPRRAAARSDAFAANGRAGNGVVEGTAGRGVAGPGVLRKGSSSGARLSSRLASPALSPRSPMHKGIHASAAAAPAASPAPRASRRSQLQGYLSKEVAMPYEVAKFKTELKGGTQSQPEVMELAGTLQEKFDRISRKLRSWDLIETTATERFNSAMDAALDAIFTRVSLNLDWLGDDDDGAPSDARVAARPVASNSRAISKGKGQANGGTPAESRSSGRCIPKQPLELSEDRSDMSSEAGYESPSSSGSHSEGSAHRRPSAAGARKAQVRRSGNDASAYSMALEDSRANGAKSRSHEKRHKSRDQQKSCNRWGDPSADTGAKGNGSSTSRASAAPQEGGRVAAGLPRHMEGGTASAHMPVYMPTVGASAPYVAFYNPRTLLASGVLGNPLPQPPGQLPESASPVMSSVSSALRGFYAPGARMAPGASLAAASQDTTGAAAAAGTAAGVAPYQLLTRSYVPAQQATADVGGSPQTSTGAEQHRSAWNSGATVPTLHPGTYGLYRPGAWLHEEGAATAPMAVKPWTSAVFDDTMYRPQQEQSERSTTAHAASSAIGVQGGPANGTALDASSAAISLAGMAAYTAGGTGFDMYRIGAAGVPSMHSISGRPLVTYDIMGGTSGQAMQYNAF